MTWIQTSLHTDKASIEVTTQTVDRWTISMTAILQGSETVSSPSVTLLRSDPATYAVVAGFASGVTVVSNNVQMDVNCSVLTRGETYLMLTKFTASSTANPVVLTTVICVA